MSGQEKALRFYQSLCREFNGSVRKQAQCVVSETLIAEKMHLSTRQVHHLCKMMYHYRITERQGGGVVI